MNKKLNFAMLSIVWVLCIVICFLKMGYIKVFLLGIQIGLAIYNITLNIIDIVKTSKEIKQLEKYLEELEKEIGICKKKKTKKGDKNE